MRSPTRDRSGPSDPRVQHVSTGGASRDCDDLCMQASRIRVRPLTFSRSQRGRPRAKACLPCALNPRRRMSERVVPFFWSDDELATRLRDAVRSYWDTRGGQAARQRAGGAVVDAGARSEVTGGQHMNGFMSLLTEIIQAAGFSADEVRLRSGLELPGFYRPLKKWDLVVVRNGSLCAAIELKSQVGPSFGNNCNNRTEEAVGSSSDFWIAFREGLIGPHQPWLGYFFLLEEAPGSMRPIGLAPAIFRPDRVFEGTSYADRYEILCRRMVRERNYSAASMILSRRDGNGTFSEPAADLQFSQFVRSLYGHLLGCGG
jgi:hypothetical protein